VVGDPLARLGRLGEVRREFRLAALTGNTWGLNGDTADAGQKTRCLAVKAPHFQAFSERFLTNLFRPDS
jgi:hypothetical protein